MVAPTPIAWDTIEDAIAAWFAGATGLTTIWRNQSGPQPSHPYASLLLTGPRRIGGEDEHRYTTAYPLNALDVTITPIAQDSTTYTTTINGTAFVFVSDADATVAEIVTGIVALISLGSEPVTATDLTTHFTLVGDDDVLFTLALTDDFDAAQISYANNDEGHEVAITVSGQREITISCQIYVGRPDSLSPTAHALHLMTIANSSLGLPAVKAAFVVAGLAIVDEGEPVDISEIVGAAFDSRSNMDVRFGLASNIVERMGYIHQTTVETDLSNPSVSETNTFGGT